jgi:hypothetical protein
MRGETVNSRHVRNLTRAPRPAATTSAETIITFIGSFLTALATFLEATKTDSTTTDTTTTTS